MLKQKEFDSAVKKLRLCHLLDLEGSLFDLLDDVSEEINKLCDELDVSDVKEAYKDHFRVRF